MEAPTSVAASAMHAKTAIWQSVFHHRSSLYDDIFRFVIEFQLQRDFYDLPFFCHHFVIKLKLWQIWLLHCWKLFVTKVDIPSSVYTGVSAVKAIVNPHRWQLGQSIRRRCWWPLHKRLMCPHDSFVSLDTADHLPMWRS
jgi:hypothetical protein